MRLSAGRYLAPRCLPPRKTSPGTASDLGRETVWSVALPLSLGYSECEVAASLGVAVEDVRRELDSLRDELRWPT
jgi:hypothetical protein